MTENVLSHRSLYHMGVSVFVYQADIQRAIRASSSHFLDPLIPPQCCRVYSFILRFCPFSPP
jgi:hypothetical protein